MPRVRLLLLAAALAITPCRTAVAQSEADRTTARVLFYEARQALDAGRWEQAADLFEHSNRIFPAPTAALGLARALAGGGHLMRAYETYTSILTAELPATASPPFQRAVAEARREREVLAPRLPALVLHVRGPAAPIVSLDGRPLASAALGQRSFVEPGEHVIEAGAPGFVSQRRDVRVAEGETQNIDIQLSRLATLPVRAPARDASPAAAPGAPGMTPLRVTGLVVGGVGIAALAAAAVSGGLYLSAKATVDETCRETGPGAFSCKDTSGADAAAAGRTYGWINGVTLVGGLAATGVGVTLFALGGRDARASVRGSGRGVELRGSF